MMMLLLINVEFMIYVL